MARALVTGALGFIGRGLVNALVERGSRVVALDRMAADQDDGGDRGVERVIGDVRDPEAMGRVVEDFDVIYHLAAATAPRSLAASRAVNVEGTRNIVSAAAKQSDPPVFIYVSSLASAGPGDSPVIETSPCCPISAYGRAKLEAEQVLQGFADRLPITVVRPACVFGPGDRNLLSLFKIVRRGWDFHSSAQADYSFLHVDDLLAGLVAAADRGQRLQGAEDAQRTGIYFLADPEPVTFPQLAEMIAQCLDRARVRHVKIPHAVAWCAAMLGETIRMVTGRRVYLNLDKVREAYGGSWVCDPARAQAELDFVPAANMLDRLQETKAGFDARGWL